MAHLVQELTDIEFNEKVTDKQANLGLVLVDFWAPWCEPCKQLAPFVEQLAEKLEGKLTVYKLNVQCFKEAATQLGIRSIPNLVLFKNGVQVDQRIGSLLTGDVSELVTFVEKYLD